MATTAPAGKYALEASETVGSGEVGLAATVVAAWPAIVGHSRGYGWSVLGPVATIRDAAEAPVLLVPIGPNGDRTSDGRHDLSGFAPQRPGFEMTNARRTFYPVSCLQSIGCHCGRRRRMGRALQTRRCR